MVKILPDHAFPLPPLSAARSILVIKLDALGDAILLSPFLFNLRANCPSAKITLVAPKANASLFEFCDVVDNKIFLSKNWHEKEDSVAVALQELQTFGPYDIAIVPRWESDHYGAGFLAARSQARIRMAYSALCLPRKLAINPNADQDYTHTVEDQSNQHDVMRNLILLEALGGDVQNSDLRLWPSPDDNKTSYDFLSAHNLQSKAFMIIAPGAMLAKKIWPARSWFEFMQYWVKEKDIFVVMIGAGDIDERMAAQLTSIGKQKIISAVGRFNPRETTSFIKHARGIIGADSFAKHAAAISEVPYLEISCHPADGDPSNEYHSSRFGYWHDGQVAGASLYRVLQPSTCGIAASANPLEDHPHCIDRVSVADVKNAIDLFFAW